MKNSILTAFIAFLVLPSFITVSAQGTAGVVPIKTSVNDSADTSAANRPLTEIYRVGVGDVLDIRLLNSPNNRSTLFTVVGSGVIDVPVAGGTVSVAGLTPEQIQNIVSTELRRRAIEENAQVSVAVRQYLSHSITITGLVSNPGTRFLRRERVPLYVVLAEAQLRNDGGRVVILRNGTPSQTYDLSDPTSLNVNVESGDIITVSGRPQEFYYIGGKINYPGQKVFQPGITLLQAILAAGGSANKDSRVEISREGADGKLVTVRYSTKQIKSGAVQDPKLQVGDRIEVTK